MDEKHNKDSYTFISNKPNKGNSDRRINPRPRRSIVRSFRLRLKAHDKNNPKDQNFSYTTNLPTQRRRTRRRIHHRYRKPYLDRGREGPRRDEVEEALRGRAAESSEDLRAPPRLRRRRRGSAAAEEGGRSPAEGVDRRDPTPTPHRHGIFLGVLWRRRWWEG